MSEQKNNTKNEFIWKHGIRITRMLVAQSVYIGLARQGAYLWAQVIAVRQKLSGEQFALLY